MRKQGLLLLTFMSVVMMLSIYYITLPMDETTDTVNTEFDTALLEKNAENQEYINNESKVVSSVSSSASEKQTALSNIENKKKLMNLESEVEDKLRTQGITAICSIKEDVVYITVNDNEKSKEKVLKILEIIMPEISGSYLYEISFMLK